MDILLHDMRINVATDRSFCMYRIGSNPQIYPHKYQVFDDELISSSLESSSLKVPKGRQITQGVKIYGVFLPDDVSLQVSVSVGLYDWIDPGNFRVSFSPYGERPTIYRCTTDADLDLSKVYHPRMAFFVQDRYMVETEAVEIVTDGFYTGSYLIKHNKKIIVHGLEGCELKPKSHLVVELRDGKLWYVSQSPFG